MFKLVWIKWVGFVAIFVVFSFLMFLSIIAEDSPREQNTTLKSKLISYPMSLEDRFFDYRNNLSRSKSVVDDNMVLAAIDDSSVMEIGQFPWGRDVWARLTSKLKILGAKVLAYDVFFSEADMLCGNNSPDQLFASSLTDFKSVPGNSVIIPYTVIPDRDGSEFITLPKTKKMHALISVGSTAEDGIDVGMVPKYVARNVFPLKLLYEQSSYIGHLGVVESADGTFRNYNVLSYANGKLLPSFGLEIFRAYTNEQVILRKKKGSSNLQVEIGKDKIIEIDKKGNTRVRWLGDARSFVTVGINKILNARDDDARFKKMLSGKIVFIGSTAFAAHDLRYTPIDPKLSGVYYHMNFINMLINGNFYRLKAQSFELSWLVLIIGVVLIILIQLFKNALLDVVALLLLIGTIIYCDIVYLIPDGYYVRLLFTLFAIFSCYLWGTIWTLYYSNKDKRFLKRAFSSYISPELIDVLSKDQKLPSLGGESRFITALFSDIQNFSTISEVMPPEQLIEYLNVYLTAMTDILLKHNGTLDKYQGDAIVAFFGAPVKLKDHAVKACMTAYQMQVKLDLIRDMISKSDLPDIAKNLRARVGINTGDIITGNIGSSTRMNYTMIGDSVNLTARLESSCKKYGIFIHVSEDTWKLAKDSFVWRDLDKIQVVGKNEVVSTFELLGLNDDKEMVELSELFNKGRSEYKNRNFKVALSCFEQALEVDSKRFGEYSNKINPSKVYIDRCKEFILNPPEQAWNGVYILKSK